MAKGVLIHNPQSKYNDNPAEYYHFPKQYKSRLVKNVGDWVVYYQSGRNGGPKAYKAVAEIYRIRPDLETQDHFYADIVPNSYLEFPDPVPLQINGTYANRLIQKDVGKPNGVAQSAVQPLEEADFWSILRRGTLCEELELPRRDTDSGLIIEDVQAPFDMERPRVDLYLSRPLRDKAFRQTVINAYDKRCAFTGLSFINGHGRAEVEAAHIKPVHKKGPDTVRNGIALSGTIHWMFDRGLLSLSDNHEILVSRHINNIDEINRLLVPKRQAIMPKDSKNLPHKTFLEWHRDKCFKT